MQGDTITVGDLVAEAVRKHGNDWSGAPLSIRVSDEKDLHEYQIDREDVEEDGPGITIVVSAREPAVAP